jgi:hypothetical protein
MKVKSFNEFVNESSKMDDDTWDIVTELVGDMDEKDQLNFNKIKNQLIGRWDADSFGEMPTDNMIKHWIKVAKETMDTYESASINEAESATQEHLDMVISALPQLEALIEKYGKFKVKLKAELQKNRSGETISIFSDDITDLLSPLGKTIFSKFAIGFWGGSVTKDGNIWFNPKVWYEHPMGGSNGTDFIWDALWFDVEKGTWIEGRRKI